MLTPRAGEEIQNRELGRDYGTYLLDTLLQYLCSVYATWVTGRYIPSGITHKSFDELVYAFIVEAKTGAWVGIWCLYMISTCEINPRLEAKPTSKPVMSQ